MNKERSPWEKITIYGLEVGINKLEREIDKTLFSSSFDVDKLIILENLKEEAERRNYVVFKTTLYFHISEGLKRGK